MSSKANTELVERLLHPQVFPRVKRKLARLAEVLESIDPLAAGIYSAAAALPVDRVPPAAEFVPFVESLQPKIASDRDLSRNLRELADRVDGAKELSAPELLVDSVNAQMRKLHQLRAAGLVSREQYAEAELAWDESLIPFVDVRDSTEGSWFTQEFLDTAVPPPPFLVQDFIGLHQLSILTGPGGAGKGRLATSLAFHASQGDPEWLPDGPPLQIGGPLRTMVVSTEDDPRNYASDIRAAATSGRIEVVDPGKFGFINYVEHSLDRTGQVIPFWKGGKLSQVAVDLLDSLAEQGTGLLILDNAASLYHDNENDRQLVSAFCVTLNHRAARDNMSILLLSHPPKQQESARHGYSGSTAWINVTRNLFEMNVSGEADSKARYIRTRKSSHGRKRKVWLAQRGPWWRGVEREEAVIDYMENFIDDDNREKLEAKQMELEEKREKKTVETSYAKRYADLRNGGMPAAKAHAKVGIENYGAEVPVPSEPTLRRIANKERYLK